MICGTGNTSALSVTDKMRKILETFATEKDAWDNIKPYAQAVVQNGLENSYGVCVRWLPHKAVYAIVVEDYPKKVS